MQKPSHYCGDPGSSSWGTKEKKKTKKKERQEKEREKAKDRKKKKTMMTIPPHHCFTAWPRAPRRKPWTPMVAILCSPAVDSSGWLSLYNHGLWYLHLGFIPE